MHRNVDLKILYFGTPVVLISTRNPETPDSAAAAAILGPASYSRGIDA